LIVVLDACVLYSAMLRDLWMRLILEEAIDARWTTIIHAEWTRNILIERPGSTSEQWNRVVDLMNQYARNALVTDFEHHISSLVLPDPDDRHVFAAAIQCHASMIVTLNLKDFPTKSLKPYGIQAVHPDDFLLEVLKNNLNEVLVALRKQRAQLIRPAMSASEFLDQLEKHHLPRSAAKLRVFQAQI
jgi:predicted nucleic acid-binding protein